MMKDKKITACYLVKQSAIRAMVRNSIIDDLIAMKNRTNNDIIKYKIDRIIKECESL